MCEWVCVNIFGKYFTGNLACWETYSQRPAALPYRRGGAARGTFTFVHTSGCGNKKFSSRLKHLLIREHRWHTPTYAHINSAYICIASPSFRACVCVCVCKWDGQDESLKLKWSQNKRNREMRVLSPALGDNAWYGGQGEMCEREGWQLRRDGVVAGVTATRRRHSFANYWPWKMTVVSIKNSRTHKVFHASICLNCHGKSHESTYGKFPWPPLKAIVSPHTSTDL